MYIGILLAHPIVHISRIRVKLSPPSSAEGENEWSYTSTSPGCLQGVNRERVYLYTALCKIFEITSARQKLA
jgi:hypothetical protein